MTGTLITPVIPSPAAAAGRPARPPAAARTLPLAVPPALSRPPALGRDVVYGLARASTAPAAWPTGRSPARWAGAAGTG